MKRSLLLLALLGGLWAQPVEAAISLNTPQRFISAGGHGNGTFTTGSFTPQANSLIVVIVHSMSGGATNYFASITIADSQTHTWTLRADADWAAWQSNVRIYTAPNVATTAFTVDVDAAAEDIRAWYVDVISVTGQHASPIGANAQADDQSADGAESVTLSGAPATTSYVIAAAISILNSTGATGITHGTGWTEIDDDVDDQWLIAQAQFRTGSTSTTVAWDDIYVGTGGADGSALVALEIIAAAEGGAAPISRLMLLGVGP